MSHIQLITNCTGNNYNFSYITGNKQNAIELFAKDLNNVMPECVKVLKQVHGNEIVEIEDPNLDVTDIEADGIITKLKDICIGITTADCIPLIIFDPKNEVISCLHLGRKSLLLGLLEKTLTLLTEKYNSNPANLEIYIYPSLQKKSHLVYDFEALKFPEKYLEFLPKGLHFINNSTLFWEHLEKNNIKTSDMINISSAFIDPVQFVKDKLKIAGVLETNITENNIDTFADKRYHSYRRDYPKHGLMLSYVMMKNVV